MKVLIIHLSDIHLKPEDNISLKRKELIYKAFQNQALEADSIFMVVSGDIASSGKETEYKQATELLKHIKNYIQEYTKKEMLFIIVPGNHDCDHDSYIKNQKVRQTLIDNIHQNQSKAIDEGVINQCCEVQTSFFDFLKRHQDNDKILHSDRLLNMIEFKYDDTNILFQCYNTSWISQFCEQPGKMYFPVERFPAHFLNYRSDLSISVLHHTFNWQNCINSRELRTHLEKTSDLILTGHEHVFSKSVRDDLEGNLTEYIEGTVLQEHSNGEISGFNLIYVDLKNDIQQIDNFKWNGEIYSIDNKTSTTFLSKRDMRLNKRLFEINNRFEKNLNDPGARFTHPNKSEISLEDLFIYPNLRVLNIDRYSKKNALEYRVSSKIIFKINKTSNKILLIGEEKSGKTTLCKALTRYFYSKGYVPVYVEGHNIRLASIETFNKLVKKCFEEQYSQEKIERFEQLENTQKLILIDDFDKTRLNIKYRSRFLHNINKTYPNLIITANEIFQMERMVYEEKEKKSGFEDYQQYRIMEFGHVLRNKLIEKWNVLGQEQYIEESDLIRKTDTAQQVVDTIIGSNFIPSYPVFLLTILQTLEAQYPHNLRYSSYGYYYDVLITQALARIDKKHEEIDAFYNYVTELANYLFENRIRKITKENLFIFHDHFCREYAVRLNFDYYIASLLDASILEETGNVFWFKYKYIFYFFVARYLSHNITREDVKERISQMCKELYREEFANIIMFLTHHSKDPFILDEILAIAKSLFSEFAPIKFEDDISAVNELIDEIPRLILKDKDIQKAREEKLIAKDEKELSEQKLDNEEEDIDTDFDGEAAEFDLISQLNLAFKTLEIIGQILKNYYSSLKADKKNALCEQAYFTGLRPLKPFCEALEGNINYFVNEIKSVIEREKLVHKDKIEKVSRRLLFRMCQMVFYAFIKKISGSIGSEKLSETYKQILENNNFISVHMVDVSIKLDFFKGFPYDDIRKLERRLTGNTLPYTVLQQMVINYLYMFPVSYDDKQKICSKLHIPIETQRVIQADSTQR